MMSTDERQGFTIVELLIVIVVIAILAALAIVGYNGISERAYNAEFRSTLSQWKRKSETHKIEKNIECPENYAFIYGNATLGTNDFCVMKYEARNVGGVATSQAGGTPWVNITQPTAISTAAAACTGCHLLTEAEWMTIAADALSVKYNWTGRKVGAGFISQGHINSNPASALSASTDDFDTLNGISGGTGSDTSSNGSRILYLSSGDALWDLSGNVWEWTTTALATTNVGVSGDSAVAWREWTNSSLSYGNLPAGSRPSALAGIPALSAIGSWNSTQGIGQVYTNYADNTTKAFLRGSGWNNTNGSGVLTLNLNRGLSYSFQDVGFRVAR